MIIEKNSGQELLPRIMAMLETMIVRKKTSLPTRAFDKSFRREFGGNIS